VHPGAAALQRAERRDRGRAAGRRAADPLRQHPRDRRLVEGPRRGDAEARRADRRGAAAAARAGAAVAYRSSGRVLVVGAADAASRAARLLSDKLDVSLLLPRPGGALAQERTVAVHAGTVTALSGWLGAFHVRWTSGNPIDLDLCTRCNACIEACPEQAIDFSYQIDLARCKSHRDCVRVCEAAGAIDFARTPEEVEETFDSVLDLGAEPLLAAHQPPQGYFHAGDEAALLDAVLQLRESVGEFEKPTFFQYWQKLCAHSRNEQIGCTACIDVCSADAISSQASMKGRTTGGAGIAVEPHLCVGCGACTTVCPSGALTYAAPRPEELGLRLRTLLATYARAGGRDAALLLHSGGAGRARSARSAAPRAPTRRCTACRRAFSRSRSGTRRRSGSTSGSRRSPSARRRSGC
jgi:ferredoxin